MISLATLQSQVVANIQESEDLLLEEFDINMSINELENNLRMLIVNKLSASIMEKIGVAIDSASSPEEAIARGVDIIAAFQQRILSDGNLLPAEYYKLVITTCNALIAGVPDLLMMEEPVE